MVLLKGACYHKDVYPLHEGHQMFCAMHLVNVGTNCSIKSRHITIHAMISIKDYFILMCLENNNNW